MSPPRPESVTEKLERRNRELTILNAIAEALNRPVDLDQSLQTALGLVAELLDLRTGWIFLLEEETLQPYLAASQNLPPGLASRPSRMQGLCHCLETYLAGDLSGAANVNVVRCSRLKWLMDEGSSGGLRYHASIPLYASGRKLGVLNVASPDWRELSPDDLRLLYIVGDLLSIAIERARLFARSAHFGAIEERNRLAREIHDTLAQGLAAIALRLEAADALIEGGATPDRVGQAVRKALELTRSGLEEARRSVLDLRAAPLEGKRLGEALEQLVREQQEQLSREQAEPLSREQAFPLSPDAGERPAHSRPTTSIRLEREGRREPLPARIEVGLYRIAQEALHNALRHAEAASITIRLHTTPDTVALSIDDDGRGFDPARVPDGRYGLVGMNERARLLGGSLTLKSCPGAGTRLEVVVPLSGPRKDSP